MDLHKCSGSGSRACIASRAEALVETRSALRTHDARSQGAGACLCCLEIHLTCFERTGLDHAVEYLCDQGNRFVQDRLRHGKHASDRNCFLSAPASHGQKRRQSPSCLTRYILFLTTGICTVCVGVPGKSDWVQHLSWDTRARSMRNR